MEVAMVPPAPSSETKQITWTVEDCVRGYLRDFATQCDSPRGVEELGRAYLAGGAAAMARTAQLLAYLPRGAAHAFPQAKAAQALGLSRTYLCVLLGRLADRGILRVEGRKLRVELYTALKLLAAGHPLEEGP
jgi:hypothetical protein